MSIALATRGVIGGFTGGGSGDTPIYIEVPLCLSGPENSQFVGKMTLSAKDPEVLSAIPNPTSGMEIRPRRRSQMEVLPNRGSYPTPGNL